MTGRMVRADVWVVIVSTPSGTEEHLFDTRESAQRFSDVFGEAEVRRRVDHRPLYWSDVMR